MSYRRVVLREFGGPEKLDIETVDTLPEPGTGQLRVRVLTAGVGFTDTIIREGQYPDVKEKPPFTPGYDWFGVVDEVGDGVREFAPGDRVADMSVIGGYTEYLVCDAGDVIPAPEGVDPGKAVAMLLSYGTAYQMLTRIRELPPGSTCLVHAAGGAVGTAMLDLGRHLGLKMYGTASTAKHAAIKALGATPIDYRSEDFVARIREETGGAGVDAVFDTIGGAHWARSYRCVKRGGILVAFGALQVTTGEESVPSLLRGFFKLMVGWRLLPDGKRSCFYNIHSRRKKYPGEFRQDIETLFGLLKAGKIDPLIEREARLADIVEVHRQVDAAQITGKVVLKMDSGDTPGT